MKTKSNNRPAGPAANLRKFASVLLAICFVLPVPTAGLAQDADGAKSNSGNGGQADGKQNMTRQIPQRTVGLEPGKVVRWTLRDAVLNALDKNVDIELERENVRLSQYDIVSALGFYDFSTSAAFSFLSAKNPNSFPSAEPRITSPRTTRLHITSARHRIYSVPAEYSALTLITAG
ncbi:MAG: hypothetical protein IPO77_12180 [Acidobacteria bacterium]|nr:hypothetical protein [Acidobacteriota bacterium]